MEFSNEKLKEVCEWLIHNYIPEDGAITVHRSWGNFDDVFEDGMRVGRCIALYEVCKELGLEIDEPDEPDEE